MVWFTLMNRESETERARTDSVMGVRDVKTCLTSMNLKKEGVVEVRFE